MSKYRFTKLQEEWLQELESGRIPKAKRALTRLKGGEIQSQCCLGKACEIFRAKKKALLVDIGIYRGKRTYNRHDGTLPREIFEAFKLRTDAGDFRDAIKHKNSFIRSLAGLNDKTFMTHPQIAAYIRKNPLNVFNS